jgi:hypothetical protein
MALADRPQLGGAGRRQGVGPRAGLEVDVGDVRVRACGRAHEIDDLVREIGVGQRVVGRPPVDRGDRRSQVLAIGFRPQAHGQLIDLVQPALGCDLDERDREQRRDGVHEGGLEHARRGTLAALRAEPRLPREELAQLGLRQACEVKHRAVAVAASRSLAARA